MSQISFFDGSKQFKFTKPIRLIELFGGIGSQAKALERLSNDFGIAFEHYKLCEFDKYAICSYNAIHNTNFEVSDITKISAKDLQIVDKDKYQYLMTYSFPCQDLSKAGKQKGMSKGTNTRSGLLWEVERILKECKELPDVLLMENVPDVIGTKNRNDFFKWIEQLEKLGYKNYYQCLNSKNYGVAQNRDRCFMISILGDYYYEFPKPFKLNKCWQEFISPKYEIKKHNKTKSRDEMRKKCVNITNKQYCNTVSLKQDRYHNAGIIDYKGYYRLLTPRECYRLMNFDDEDFNKARKSLIETFYKGKDRANSQLYKQAGNSIVVNVLYEIIKQMI